MNPCLISIGLPTYFYKLLKFWVPAVVNKYRTGLESFWIFWGSWLSCVLSSTECSISWLWLSVATRGISFELKCNWKTFLISLLPAYWLDFVIFFKLYWGNAKTSVKFYLKLKSFISLVSRTFCTHFSVTLKPLSTSHVNPDRKQMLTFHAWVPTDS